jgi:hypothetical protein
MNCVFSQDEKRVVLTRKVLSLRRKLKNPNDKRIQNRPLESTVFYLPISKDLVQRLELQAGDYVIAEIGKAPEPKTSEEEKKEARED